MKKTYAVVWTKEASKEYGAKAGSITTVEPKEDFKVPTKSKIYKRKFFYGSSLAIFSTRAEAEAYRAGNEDWVVTTLLIFKNV